MGTIRQLRSRVGGVLKSLNPSGTRAPPLSAGPPRLQQTVSDGNASFGADSPDRSRSRSASTHTDRKRDSFSHSYGHTHTARQFESTSDADFDSASSRTPVTEKPDSKRRHDADSASKDSHRSTGQWGTGQTGTDPERTDEQFTPPSRTRTVHG